MAKRILVIDNDADCRDVVKEVLEYEGFEVRADDGHQDVFAQLNEFQPGLLLIDYLLDGINGGEICSQIKRNGQFKSLPIIIFSAYPKVISSLGFYGSDAFIPKPFDLEDLLTKVNTYYRG